jgi:hypothetical protein
MRIRPCSRSAVVIPLGSCEPVPLEEVRVFFRCCLYISSLTRRSLQGRDEVLIFFVFLMGLSPLITCRSWVQLFGLWRTQSRGFLASRITFVLLQGEFSGVVYSYAEDYTLTFSDDRRSIRVRSWPVNPPRYADDHKAEILYRSGP